MKSLFKIIIIILYTTIYTLASSNNVLKVEQLNENELTIFVDEWTHIDYGLAYPLTYEISIPSGSNNLQAYARKGKGQDWINLGSNNQFTFLFPEKTSSKNFHIFFVLGIFFSGKR